MQVLVSSAVPIHHSSCGWGWITITTQRWSSLWLHCDGHGLHLHLLVDWVVTEEASWDDIGGMDEVKARVREDVEWPLRHPDAFAHLCIRNPKGILLFGSGLTPPHPSLSTPPPSLIFHSHLSLNNFVLSLSLSLLPPPYHQSPVHPDVQKRRWTVLSPPRRT